MSHETLTTPWAGVTARWRADRDDGAVHGCGVELIVESGSGYPVHRLPGVETVIYVAGGVGVHRGSGGELPLERDQGLVVPEGSWHGFENSGPEDAVLVIAYTGPTAIPWDRAESPTEDVSEDGVVFVHRLHEIADDASAVPDLGFHDMKVSFSGAAGAAATTLGSGRWPGGYGQHKSHLHTSADELIYILDGVGQHLTDSGTLLLAAGDLAWVPPNEYHAMRSNDEGRDLDAVFFYVGAATLEDSGYRPREVAPSS
jgi:quercetin dioxygenase-like cupin family protein